MHTWVEGVRVQGSGKSREMGTKTTRVRSACFAVVSNGVPSMCRPIDGAQGTRFLCSVFGFRFSAFCGRGAIEDVQQLKSTLFETRWKLRRDNGLWKRATCNSFRSDAFVAFINGWLMVD
jgi:hypothetical protein